MLLPDDGQEGDWQQDNLEKWRNPKIRELSGRLHRDEPYSIQLTPLDAKALHVIGLLAMTFNGAGHMLYFGRDGPFGNYYLHAYLLACTAIELLGRCTRGDQDLRRDSDGALRAGFQFIDLPTVVTNELEYTLDQLVALRNLAAHGQGIASARGAPVPVFLHVELLDSFPEHLSKAFDEYHRELFESDKSEMRRRLASVGVEPVLYSEKPGQVWISAIRYAYQAVYAPRKLPSQALQHMDWQVYK